LIERTSFAPKRPFDDSGMAFAAFAGFNQARVLGQAFDSEVAEGVFTVDLWL
jgi:hypothetical protein